MVCAFYSYLGFVAAGWVLATSVAEHVGGEFVGIHHKHLVVEEFETWKAKRI